MSVVLSSSLYVVADIGGTNARFALVKEGSSQLHAIEKFRCADFPFFIDAVRAYLSRGHVSTVAGICLAVAGPVEQDWIDLPNNHWAFSRSELEQQLGVAVTIINDFSAQVLSIGGLATEDFHWIGSARPVYDEAGVIAVLGPGTGLGVAAMLPGGAIVPSEAGHVAFAPTTQHEVEILGQLWQRYERVSVERLLSGMGLANLYWANSRLRGDERELPAPEVTAGCRAGDPVCQAAIKDFCNILGAVAGDVALSMGAMSGVYLSGGILPQMLDILEGIAIRASFDNKGRFSAICARIPMAIVLADNPGLIGCSPAVCRDHESDRAIISKIKGR